MSWSLTAQGHTLSKDDEAELIEALRELFEVERAGVSYATIGTQHHGQVDLKATRPSEPA